MKGVVGGCALTALFSVLIHAQDAERGMAARTRAEEIEAKREQKARDLKPEQATGLEHALSVVKNKNIVARITSGTAGLGLKIGGLITGSGFALGPQYIRRGLLHNQVTFRTSARGSLRKYYLLDAELDMPSLARGWWFANLYGVHKNYPSLDYYGPGPNSAKTGRSNFLLEETSFDGRTGLQPVQHLRLGVLGSYKLINIGRGRDERFASTEQTFSDATTPGLNRQTDYLGCGTFIQYDWRDNPSGARRGGNYRVQYATLFDRKYSSYSFNRLDAEVQQYIPFLNETHVIALRGRTSLTDPHSGQVVPFYMQPVLGGSDDLRGFRPFRFYDNNSLVLNGEYRWQLITSVEMAVFVDAGKVFPRWGELNLQNLERDYGFGLRFFTRNNLFLRIDTAFSREGFQVWFKFSNVF